MANPQTVAKRTQIVGAGWLFVALLDAAGKPQGERYVGSTTSLTLTIEEERQTFYDPDGERAVKVIDKITQRSFTATATLLDMSPENIALLLQGDTEAVDNTGNAPRAASQSQDGVQLARWYQVGADDDDPMGVFRLKKGSVSLKYGTKATVDGGGGTDGVAGTDFEVDEEHGRIYVIGGGIVAGNTIKVSFTPDANVARIRAKTVTPARDVYAAIRYVETVSPGRNIYIRRAALGSAGDMSLKADRQERQSFDLTMGIEEPGGDLAAITFDGEAVA